MSNKLSSSISQQLFQIVDDVYKSRHSASVYFNLSFHVAKVERADYKVVALLANQNLENSNTSSLSQK